MKNWEDALSEEDALRLFHAVQQLREEAEEVSRAAREESDGRLAEEAADLLYHLQVLLLSRDVPLAAALEVLNGRRG